MTNVDSKRAADDTDALRIAEIIFERIPGTHWAEAMMIGAVVVVDVMRPRLDGAEETIRLVTKMSAPNPNSLIPGGL